MRSDVSDFYIVPFVILEATEFFQNVDFFFRLRYIREGCQFVRMRKSESFNLWIYCIYYHV